MTVPPAEATPPGAAGSAPGAVGGAPVERRVVLALGSNLGDRLVSLQRAVDLLGAPGMTCVAVSGVYATVPVGGPPQGEYLNAVLLAVSAEPGAEILARCQAAEAALGRVRTERWGARTLDVDVIALGDEVSDDPVLTLPHPRAHERGFVLVPWLEADPAAVLPGRGRVADLPAAADGSGVRRLADVQIVLPAGPAG
jgi:2-amino-4-hydroxy-6-hydroxymethyldihydropteridine diphosphokinase